MGFFSDYAKPLVAPMTLGMGSLSGELGEGIGGIVNPLQEGIYGKPPAPYTADPAAFEASPAYMEGLGYLYDKAQGLVDTQAEMEGAAAANQAARAISSQAASTRGVNPALLAQMATTTQGRTQGDIAGATAREAARERENALMMFLQGLDENRKAKIQEQMINAGTSGQAMDAYKTQADQTSTLIGGMGSGLTGLGTMGGRSSQNKSMPKMDYGSVNLEGVTPNETRPQILNKSMMPGQGRPSLGGANEMIGGRETNPYFNVDLDKAVREEFVKDFNDKYRTTRAKDLESGGYVNTFGVGSDLSGTENISYDTLPTSYFMNPVFVPENIRETARQQAWADYFGTNTPEEKEKAKKLGTPTDYLQNYYKQRQERNTPEQFSLLSRGR